MSDSSLHNTEWLANTRDRGEGSEGSTEEKQGEGKGRSIIYFCTKKVPREAMQVMLV